MLIERSMEYYYLRKLKSEGNTQGVQGHNVSHGGKFDL